MDLQLEDAPAVRHRLWTNGPGGVSCGLITLTRLLQLKVFYSLTQRHISSFLNGGMAAIQNFKQLLCLLILSFILPQCLMSLMKHLTAVSAQLQNQTSVFHSSPLKLQIMCTLHHCSAEVTLNGQLFKDLI